MTTNLGPGVWTDDTGALHIDIDACLIGNGYEPNDQTRRMLETTWLDMAHQFGGELIIEESSPR